MDPKNQEPAAPAATPQADTPHVPVFDQQQVARDALNEKLRDMLVPGFEAEFSPDEAETLGAFREDALSFEDAIESTPETVGPVGAVAATIITYLATPLPLKSVTGVTRINTSALLGVPQDAPFSAVLAQLQGRLDADGSR